MTRNSFVFHAEWLKNACYIKSDSKRNQFLFELLRYATFGIEPSDDMKAIGILFAIKQIDINLADGEKPVADNCRPAEASPAMPNRAEQAEMSETASQEPTSPQTHFEAPLAHFEEPEAQTSTEDPEIDSEAIQAPSETSLEPAAHLTHFEAPSTHFEEQEAETSTEDPEIDSEAIQTPSDASQISDSSTDPPDL